MRLLFLLTGLLVAAGVCAATPEETVRKAMSSLASDIVIVSRLDVPGLSGPFVHDELQGGGAAAGIHAALRHYSRPVLVAAWDMPFITADVLAFIASRARDDADAVVVEGSRPETVETMCAWYAPRCANVIERRWDAGRSLQEIVRDINAVIIPRAEIGRMGDPDRIFFNVNTPDDLARARALA
jgi:molybdopterin-guanine dinucleotide biosynthesis protein A